MWPSHEWKVSFELIPCVDFIVGGPELVRHHIMKFFHFFERRSPDLFESCDNPCLRVWLCRGYKIPTLTPTLPVPLSIPSGYGIPLHMTSTNMFDAHEYSLWVIASAFEHGGQHCEAGHKGFIYNNHIYK